MNKRKWLVDLLMLVLFIVGVGAITYPFVSDTVSDLVDQQLINYYQGQANRENQEEMTRIQAEMEAKNKEIAERSSPGIDPYSDLDEESVTEQVPLSFYQEHTIGVITIPSIDVRLPIFDQTLAVFLEKGASLLEGTSYPTGGENTHSVLTSHTGIMQAKLFTDLQKMEKGDQFFIEINGQTLAYEVNQIKVVLPHETDDVKVVPGEDYVTLLTCTPYMINTHRLLVRGYRVPYVPEAAGSLEKVAKTQQHKMIIIGGLLLGVVSLVGWILYRILFNVLISKRTYNLNLQLLDAENNPVPFMALHVFDARGVKPVLNEDASSLVGYTNTEGRVHFEELPGGRYRLENAEKGVSLLLYVKRVKHQEFSVKRINKQLQWDIKRDADEKGVVLQKT